MFPEFFFGYAVPPAEKLVKHVGGKLLAHARAVECLTPVMVNECHPVDTPGFIFTEYHSDAVFFQHPYQFVP